jgi:hypothetical protein
MVPKPPYPQICSSALTSPATRRWKSICRGTRLHSAMSFSAPQAASFIQPLDSPWDGTLTNELTEWGYTEYARHQLCDFDEYWHMAPLFWFYRMDPRPVYRGGVNRCFDVGHGDPMRRRDGKVVPVREQRYVRGGKTYRVSHPYPWLHLSRHDANTTRPPTPSAQSASTRPPATSSSSPSNPLPTPPGKHGATSHPFQTSLCFVRSRISRGASGAV